MLRVPIAPLSDGLHTDTLRPDAADLGLDPETFRDVVVEVRLDVRGPRVLAAFTARAVATLACDRTLDLYEQPVEGSHAVLFVPPGSPARAGLDDDDDEVLPLPDDATDLDLTAPVHDTLLLALPLRRVSPAAEALDLPTTFGGPAADAPTDDRWAALQALRDGSPDSD